MEETLRQGSTGTDLYRKLSELGTVSRRYPGALLIPDLLTLLLLAWPIGFESPTLSLAEVGQMSVQKPHFLDNEEAWLAGGTEAALFETLNAGWNQRQQRPLNPRRVQ